jgi:hypothetical protein
MPDLMTFQALYKEPMNFQIGKMFSENQDIPLQEKLTNLKDLVVNQIHLMFLLRDKHQMLLFMNNLAELIKRQTRNS